MTRDQKIVEAIFRAVDEVNEYLPKQQMIEKSLQTVLIDESTQLDSLALVSLIVAIEQTIEDECAVAINLADGDLLSKEDNPLKNIEKLADYISFLVGATKR